MVDGEFISEIRMGKYEHDHLKVREEKLLVTSVNHFSFGADASN